MRTTITIDETLLREVKRVAAESGPTVSRVIGDSLRLTLSSGRRRQPQAEAFELVTYGRGGHSSPFNVDKASALLDAEDIDRFARGAGD